VRFGLKGTIPDQIDRGMRWLLISRPVIVSTILGIEIVILRGEPFPSTPLYSLTAVSWLLSLFYWLLDKVHLPRRFSLHLQVGVDAILVTAVVHFSGGVFSQFSLLYFLVIIASAILLLAKGAFLSATSATLFYSLLLWVEYRGVILKPMPGTPSLPEMTLDSVLLRGVLHTLSFYLIAAMSGFLAERVRLRGEELEEVRLTTDDILQGMKTGVISVDGRGEIVYFNKAAEQILGMSAQEARRLPIDDAVPQRLRPISGLFKQVLLEGRESRRLEVEVLMEDGSRKPLGLSVTQLSDREGRRRGALALFSDLTEAKEIERRLREADRMAAIGELSAGIAHEIRNPLASIRGSVELLSKSLNPSGDDRRLLELVVRETDRLNSFIEHFLRFARDHPPNLSRVNLVPILAEAEDLVRSHPAYTRKIAIVKEPQKGKIYAIADPEQLKQVLLNLCLNALWAMDGEGELSMTLRRQGSRVGISIRDTGTGIPEDQLTKIFEPFYSQKEKGSGLGLAIARRIVEHHGGEITVASKVGKGSEFTIWLKRAAEENGKPSDRKGFGPQ